MYAKTLSLIKVHHFVVSFFEPFCYSHEMNRLETQLGNQSVVLKWQVAKCLWRQATRITWKHAGLANVVQTKKEHCDTFQSDATAGVWGRSVTERFDVRLDLRNVCVKMRRSTKKRVSETFHFEQNWL